MRPLSKVYTALIFVILYAPIAVMVLFSFNSINSTGVFAGFSTYWYRELFRDGATLSVWFRNMPPQSFTATENEGALEVKTAGATLLIRENRGDCRIVLCGETEEKPICNDGNLLGTYRTLDECDGDLYIRTGKNIFLLTEKITAAR